MADFERVQAKLAAALAANMPGSAVDHVCRGVAVVQRRRIVAVRLRGADPGDGHRYLLAQLLLNRIDCDFVFLCSSSNTVTNWSR